MSRLLTNLLLQTSQLRAENPRVYDFQNETNNVSMNNQSLMANFPGVTLNHQQVNGFFESNGRFTHTNMADFDTNLHHKHKLPVYDATNEILPDTSNAVNSMFTQQHIKDKNALLKRLISLYWENSMADVCQEILTYQKLVKSQDQKLPIYLATAAEYIIQMVDMINAPIAPWTLAQKKESLNFSTIKGQEWCKSLIKSFAWHPHSNKFALAFKNDVVKVCSFNLTPIILKHPKQINVTALAWKPYYSSMIAIACADCIIIWDIDNLSISIKPSSSCSYVLSRRYHSDIMDIAWHPKSDYLLSVASKDNEILIWDIALKVCMPVKTIESAGFTLSRFSPNGLRLFTANMSTTFRTWDTVNLQSEKWTSLESRCNSACWSNDAALLLFSCEDSSWLYCLKFVSNTKQEIYKLYDLSTVYMFGGRDNNYSLSGNITIDDNKCSLGGAISNMCWDPSGQRLAISFKKYDIESQQNGVAVFITKCYPQLQILPLGFINNSDNSWPVSIQFKPNFEAGALLTIGWSNGRIQHVPFYFSKVDEVKSVASLGFM